MQRHELDPSQLGFEIVIEMRRAFAADLAAITMVSLDGHQFAHIMSHDASPLPEIFTQPRGPRTFAEYVLSTQTPLTVRELANEMDVPKCPMMVAEGYQSYLGVPLIFRGASIGAVELIMSTPRTWTDAEVRRLEPYANAVATRMDAGTTNAFCAARKVRS